MNLEPQETTVKLYADLLALEGRTDQAVDYWYQSLNGYRPYVQIDAYQRLIAHYKQMGHHERALHLSERLNTVYQHLKENTDTTNITELQTKFDKESAEESSRERLVIMLVAVGVLAIAILWFVWYHRRRMRSYEKTIEKMLRDALVVFGDRKCCVARELTKVHEEFLRGTISEVLEVIPDRKGEMVVVIAGAEQLQPELDEGVLIAMVNEETAKGLSKNAAVKAVASRTGVARNLLYDLVHEKRN